MASNPQKLIILTIKKSFNHGPFYAFFANIFKPVNEHFLIKKLEERKQLNAFRQLKLPDNKLDFCSNDYLGIAKHNLVGKALQKSAVEHVEESLFYKSGSTGSRLLAGNYAMIENLEEKIALFHQAPKALIFNSGYDANVGLFSCLPQRGDAIIYDQLSHASIRDGIRLSHGQSFPFKHNDLEDLEKKLKTAGGNIFVVTESVFSMDGDQAPLQQMAALCDQYAANLIVDEAHATGVIGRSGQGLVQSLGLQQSCLARIHTFGKACGVHGAVVLGSENLRNFLINFSRAFIYTTALPETAITAIEASYEIFPQLNNEREHLSAIIRQFQDAGLKYQLLFSETPIQIILIPGNDNVKREAWKLQQNGFDIRPILYPSVPKGAERLRIVLHSFNTVQEVVQLSQCLQ